jgi:hypothetical protein
MLVLWNNNLSGLIVNIKSIVIGDDFMEHYRPISFIRVMCIELLFTSMVQYRLIIEVTPLKLFYVLLVWIYSVPSTWTIQLTNILTLILTLNCRYSSDKYISQLREEGENPTSSLWYLLVTLSLNFGFKFETVLICHNFLVFLAGQKSKYTVEFKTELASYSSKKINCYTSLFCCSWIRQILGMLHCK